jgi:hypothetical protein
MGGIIMPTPKAYDRICEERDGLIALIKQLYEALDMVRDADDDCHADGLQTIPTIARFKIDEALRTAEEGCLCDWLHAGKPSDLWSYTE